MKKLLRRIRGAVGMGLTWAVGWGLVGMLIELITEFVPGWNGALIDIWPTALAVPGFLCGVGFSMVLRLAEGRRRFDELALPRFAVLGGVGGLLVGGFVVSILLGGVPPAGLAAIVGTTTLLSAASASGSLALARMGEDRDLLDASVDVAEVGLSEDEARDLLGDGA